MDCNPPGSSVHGVSQARVLEWIAVSFSRGSSRPRDQARSPTLKADSSLSEPQRSLEGYLPPLEIRKEHREDVKMQRKASDVHTPTASCTHSRPANIPEGHLRERPAQALPAALLVKVHVLPSMNPSISRCSLLGTLQSSTDLDLTV